jgi:arsenate reductase-like glutaredoxin family protein
LGGNNIELSIWLAKNPKVLQRPIVVNNSNSKAIIGRPPENLYEIL